MMRERPDNEKAICVSWLHDQYRGDHGRSRYRPGQSRRYLYLYYHPACFSKDVLPSKEEQQHCGMQLRDFPLAVLHTQTICAGCMGSLFGPPIDEGPG